MAYTGFELRLASRSDFSQTNNQNTMSTYGIPDDELAMQQREAEDGYVHDLERKLTAMIAERDTLALRVGVVETANADLAAERDALRTALDNLKP